MFRASISLACCLAGVCVLPGCGRGSEWVLTFENKSTANCSVTVTLGANGHSTATVNAVEPGKVVTMIAGNSDTVVNSIKVVYGTAERTLLPNAPLPVGKHYNILVTPEGNVVGSTVP